MLLTIALVLSVCFCVKSDYDYYRGLEKSKHLFDSNVDGMNIQYSLAFFNRSILNFGNLSFNTTLKMSKGECLNILNIGGSVSCGSSLLHTVHYDMPHGKQDAYSPILEKYLNSMWPCMRDNHSGTHMVTNWCGNGRPTASWVDEVVGTRMGEPKVLLDVDIILVDTSVNDVEEGRNQANKAKEDPVNHLKKVTELFIKILSKLPQRPSLIYVGSSTRDKTWRSPRSRTGDSVAVHLPVTNYYHVPYVSTMDALGPFVTDESLQWFLNAFLADVCCHPTKTGHRIIAAVILNMLQLHKEAATNDGEYIRIARTNYYDKQPLFASPELINQYYISLPVVIHLNMKEVHNSTDRVSVTSDAYWSVYEDRPGKPPGFISSTIGSTFQVCIAQYEVQSHLKFGVIHIELFKSYEHVGRVKVTLGVRVDKPMPHSTVTSSVYFKIGHKAIDCLWADKSSQRAVEEVRLNMNEVRKHMPSSPSTLSPTTPSFPSDSTVSTTTTLVLDFLLIPSYPARKNNKIKMFGLLLM